MFVDNLDEAEWRKLDIGLEGEPLGAPAYHPRVLLGVWLFGFMTSIRSSRKLEAACRDHLSKVNGIGPKKAEQIIVTLKHKVSQLISSGQGSFDDSKAKAWQEVSQALDSLNYTRGEISQAMQYLTAHHAGADLPFDQLLRQALGFLSKRVQ